MKARLYIVFAALAVGLAFINVYPREDYSYDMLRIMLLEKTSFKELSLEPFPLLVMMSFVFNTILSVSFITSNSLKSGSSFVLSRFEKSSRCIAFICVRTLGRAFLCAFVQAAVPTLLAAVLKKTTDVTHVADMAELAVLFILKQTVLLSGGAFVALILRKKPIGSAADVLGALFIIVLVTADVFSPCPLALVNLSANDPLVIIIEFLAVSAAVVLYSAFFKRSGDKLDERQ